ncbi:UNVERIFIED_CONTAM: hypothetical protein GTU68_055187 [Idotea baltica]|nr:hypothetical protein [Idotea baltica]
MVKVADTTGVTTLRFFHFSNAQKNNYSRGKRLRAYGEVRPGRAGLELFHPEVSFIGDHAPPLSDRLTPIYPATEGLSQQRLRSLIIPVLSRLKPGAIAEIVPEEYRLPAAKGSLVAEGAIEEALKYLHQPPVDARLDQLAAGEHPFQQRLAYEELLAHQVSLQKLRLRNASYQAPALKAASAGEKELLHAFGFELTGAQSRVKNEVRADLERSTPMMRLVQGDVGSGKTVIAALAMLQAVANGSQAVLMCPTEILAEQHRNNLMNWFKPLGIKVVYLSGRTKGKGREATLEMFKTGQAQIVVGTHALFQDDVEFKQLALVVIDEQHRFGVNQRLALQIKGQDEAVRPHQLIMTATPIPRTLAMSHYSNLDTSVIDELPPGRKPIETVAVANVRRGEVIERVRAACADGRQVYWVCTLIEESEALQAQAAETTLDELQVALPEFNIGLVHGRLKGQEKAAIMQRFKSGELNLLVATTVIEVGVDVPNASLMIIENPERLGLAQLHQLRGRVGRGAAESHCVLMYETPLGENSTQRINAMRQTNDGFKIAEIDLKLRGPGELLGARQAGEIAFHMADLMRDQQLLIVAQSKASDMVERFPEESQALINRWIPLAMQYSRA